MYYIDNNSGSPNMPALSPVQSNTPTWFTEGDKNKGISWIGQDWLNILQAELLNILDAAGIKPDKGKLNQLTLSVKAIITANAYTQANNLKEIFDAGIAAQAAARGHLGLGKLATKDSLGPTDVNALAKDQNLADVPDKAAGRASLEVYSKTESNEAYMAKSQNGADIPDKGLFAQNIGAALAFSGGIHIGGDSNPWTTAEFIAWLESQGAFNHRYWMCRGSWSYADNKTITDTGCGNICLAGAVVEVMGFRGAMTIRVTTPTTTSGGGVASAQFTYIDNGGDYSPGWRRDFNTINKPTAGDVGALPVTGGRLNGPLGIGTDNGLGGNSIVLGDNDTGFKQNGDGILDVYANNALVARLQPGKLYVVGDVLAGDGRKLSLTSNNNSALNARFNLWGDGGSRPTVIELGDDQGWHLYSQRNPDGSIVFTVNGDITANTLHAGGAIYANNGDINGSIWGGWLSGWLNNNKAARNTASLATNGWFKDASTGLIIQWGITGGNLNKAVVNLPIPFPNAGLWSLGWVSGTLDMGNDDWSNSASLLNNSQLTVTTDHWWSTAWIAIGH
ncbi:hypothetical protein AH553_23340 [Salmonella enterica subsp. diarizonae]|nr:hypothetical protein [Salmonella enterica subsp. diarizonae]